MHKSLNWIMCLLSGGVLLSCLFSCKEISKENLYELKDIEVKQNIYAKKFTKSDIEFLSVVYSDLFNRTMPSEDSKAVLELYNASGDTKTIVDMIIRNYLNRPDVIVPTSSEMRKDIKLFIRNCYKKFYIREPTQYEMNFFLNKISKNPNITPNEIFYSFLTSNEYRFF